MTDLTHVPVRNINDLRIVEALPLDSAELDAVRIPVGGLPFEIPGEAINIKQLRDLIAYSMPGWVPDSMEELIARSEAELQKLLDAYRERMKDTTLILQDLMGKIGEAQLSPDLNTKIDVGVWAEQAAEQAQNTANIAHQKAQEAAGLAVSEAEKASAYALDQANSAKELARSLAANAIAQAQQLTDQARLDAEALISAINEKVLTLNEAINVEIANLNTGLTSETITRQEGETQIRETLNAYKTVVDGSLAALISKTDIIVNNASALTQQVDGLKAQMVVVENTLTQKLDASVITNYYTKTQTEGKAAEIAAGQINTYNAGLTIGVDNILPTQIDLWEDGYWSGTDGSPVVSSQYVRTKTTVKIPVVAGMTYSLRGNTRIALVYYNASNARVGVYDSGTTSAPTTAKTITPPTGTTYARAYLFGTTGALVKPNPFNQQVLNNLEILIVKGTPSKLVWQPSSVGTQASLDANAKAITDTNAEVIRVDGKTTTNANNVAVLEGKMVNVENSLVTKAEGSALDATNVRLTNAEGVNTSQGNRIQSLENSVNSETTGLNTKASTSALNQTDSKVTAVEGQIAGHSTQLTNLAAAIQTINGTLNTKLDATVIQQYYTKTQMETKALEIASGEIVKFNASLIIGGVNLQTNADFTSPTLRNGWLPSGGTITNEAGTLKYVSTAAISSNRIEKRMSTLTIGKTYTLSVWLKTPQLAEIRTAVGVTELSKSVPAVFDATVYQQYTFTFKVTESSIILRFYVPYIPVGGTVYLDKEQLEEGSKATTWALAPEDTQAAIDANATAINNTNAEVTRVDGKTTVNANNIVALTGRVATVENNITTKADASYVQSVETRVTNAEGVNTSQGNKIQLLENSVNSETTGLNTKASTSALNQTDSKVTAVEGQVAGHSTQLTNLAAAIQVANNQIATKLDASVITNYYTKTESNAQADTIAAGKVEAYNSALVIGGQNLYYGENPVTLVGQTNNGEWRCASDRTSAQLYTYLGGKLDLDGINFGDDTVVSIEVMIPSTTVGDFSFNFGSYRFSGNSYILTPQLNTANFARDKWTRIVAPAGKLISASATVGANINVVFNMSGTIQTGATLRWRNLMMEKATKASAYAESPRSVQAKLDANATAINTTNTEVTKVDGKATTAANDIILLKNRTTNVENAVATKAEANALNDYYTKTQTEGKATEIAAGQISAYDSSLVIGGVNLVPDSNNVVITSNNSSAYPIERVQVDGVWRIRRVAGTSNVLSTYTNIKQDFPIGTVMAVSVKVKPVAVDMTLRIDFSNTEVQWLIHPDILCPVGVWTTLTAVIKTKVASVRLPSIHATTAVIGEWFEYKEFQWEYGNKITTWSPAPVDVQTKLDANASAINTTNTEVKRVNDVVVSQGNQLTTIKASVDTVTAEVAKKADASVLNNYYTKAQAEESTAGQISKFNASLVVGGDNLWLNDAAFVFTGTDTGGATHTPGKITTTTTNNRINGYAAIAPYLNQSMLILDKPVILSFDFRIAPGTPTADIPPNGYIYFRLQGSEYMQTPNIDLKTLVVGQWYRMVTTTALAKAISGALFVFDYYGNNRAGLVYEYRNLQLEQASTASSYKPSIKDVAASAAANATAINNTNTEVSRVDGVTKALTNQYTNLNASVNVVLNDITVKDTRNTNEAPAWYWANYPRRTVNEFKTQTVIGVSTLMGGTYCNLETRVYYGDASGGPIIQTATSGVDPSVYVQRQSVGSGSNATWSAWKQPLKDLRDSINTKAEASVVSAIQVKVDDMSSYASQLTVLTSRMNTAENKITVQGAVIDGVKANYMVQFEANGTVSGFGMVQETGVLGAVISAFGVNANSFYVGPPSSNKKPFIITTTPTKIGEITYPPGTWIDAAFIAEATIGTAHIQQAAITTGKIGDLQVETLKIANWAVTTPFTFTTYNTINRTGTYGSMNVSDGELLAEVKAAGFTPNSLVLVFMQTDAKFVAAAAGRPNAINEPVIWLYQDNQRKQTVHGGVKVNNATKITFSGNYVNNVPQYVATYEPSSYEASLATSGTIMFTVYANATGDVNLQIRTGISGEWYTSGQVEWSHKATQWFMQGVKK